MKVLASLLILLLFLAELCCIAGSAWFMIQGNEGYVVRFLLSTYLLWILTIVLCGLVELRK